MTHGWIEFDPIGNDLTVGIEIVIATVTPSGPSVCRSDANTRSGVKVHGRRDQEGPWEASVTVVRKYT